MDNTFGDEIRNIRMLRGLDLSLVAEEIGIDKGYLSKIENGKEKPSLKFFRKIARHYSLSNKEIEIIARKANLYWPGLIEKEVKNMKNDEDKVIERGQIKVNFPANIPILYTDSIFVSSNEWGLVLDIAQRTGLPAEQNIVARIGMSIQHAEGLVKAMIDNLEKYKTKNIKTSVKN